MSAHGFASSILGSTKPDAILRMPISSNVYKSVLANVILGGNRALDQHSIQGGVEILFMLLKSDVSTCLMGHVAQMKTLP